MYFKLKIKTENMFPTNYFRIRKTFFNSKTQISEKFQTFQCFYGRELVYINP